MSTRKPTAAERAVFNRFRRALVRGRRYISGYLAAAACMAQIEKWRRDAIARGLLPTDFLPPVFTREQVERAQRRASSYNKIEDALAGLLSGQYGFQVGLDPSGEKDISVFKYPRPTMEGILVLMIAGAAVVIGGLAILRLIDLAVKTNAQKLKVKLTEINRKMSHAPPPVRASFEALQKSAPFRENKSVWDRISETMGGAAVLIALIIGGLMLSKVRPRQTTRPASNPCGGATTSPYDWDVAWSEDPEKAERQLEYVLDSMRNRSLAKRWEGAFSGMAAEGEEEVPF